MQPILRVGLAGLGTVSRQIRRALAASPGARLAAAADLRPAVRQEFAAASGLPVYDTVEAMCRGADIDAVWVATPNEFHCAHAVAAAAAGRHVICEKPLAVSLAEAESMIAAAAAAGVQLVQGGSKVYQPPVRALREIVAGGRLGRVVQVASLNYNDWLQRPRLAAELDAGRGGGIVLRQGPHMVDIVRAIVGDRVWRVRAATGRWDAALPAEGNFAAFLEFEQGAVASLTLDGYGWFDASELTWGIGEGGQQRDLATLRRARARRTRPLSEAEKYAAPAGRRAPLAEASEARRMPFYGLTIVSCERGTIRQSPDGLLVYGPDGCEEIVLPPPPPGSPELAELRSSLAENRPAHPGGEWGRDTLAICLAIRRSAERGTDVAPEDCA